MKKWYFPSAMNIGIKGFNDIGEEFKDNPMYHLAKEICQNSLDTKVTEEFVDNGEPIKVVFNEFWIDPKNLPGNENDNFLKILTEEFNFNDNYYKRDKEVPNFYKKAISLMKDTSIRCLRISDFNTPGLIGSDQSDHSPWSDLTKNAGVSDKPEGSSGSKGKGKFASFICSDLYTVYYSTKALDYDASCGISRLTGYKKEDGSITIGEGYYDDNSYPIRECINLDTSFIRNSYGTDLYIIGYKNFVEWQEKIAAAIIDNFFVSIIREDLEVNVNNKYYLSKASIDSLIRNENIRKFIASETLSYYNIMIADDVISEKYSLFEKEDLELLLKKDDNDVGEINKVAVVRLTGMKILDLKHFPRLGIYHGILFMKGLKVNDYFRKIENATHSNWSSDRSSNPQEAEAKIKTVRKFISDIIKKYMAEVTIEEMSATGLGETLPDEEEFSSDDEKTKKIETLNGNVKIKINEKLIKSSKKQSMQEKFENEDVDIVLDEEGEIIIQKPEPSLKSPSNFGPHPNSLPFAEHNYSQLIKKVLPNKLRVIENIKNYKLLLSLNDDEEILKISFEIYGESNNEKVKINSAKCYINSTKEEIKVENHNMFLILTNARKNIIYGFEFCIESDGIWPLEVKLYGSNQ